MSWRQIWQIGWLSLGLLLAVHPSALAVSGDSDRSDPYIRPRATCPDDLETLVAMLLRDLPSYANRVSQRAFELDQDRSRPGYILLAGRPEFEPLTLGPGTYTPANPDASPPQIFFTTLERQYVGDRSVNLQQYHWLFLTEVSSGWRFVLMLSQIGGYPTDQPPSPPEDSSNGVVGRAIQLWLRDCRTGNVQSL